MASSADLRRKNLDRLKTAADKYIKEEKDRIDQEVEILQKVLDGRNGGQAIKWDGVKVVSKLAESDLADFLLTKGAAAPPRPPAGGSPPVQVTVAPPAAKGPRVMCPRCWKRGTEPRSKSPCSYCKGDGLVVDTKLSKHFYLSTLLYSDKARARGVPNNPTTEAVSNLIQLATTILDGVVDGFGAVTVSSGYRSPAVNAMAGGVEVSAHGVGFAADLVPSSGSVKALMDWLVNSGKKRDQFIYEDQEWVHTGIRQPVTMQQRMQSLMMFSGAYRLYNPSDPRVV